VEELEEKISYYRKLLEDEGMLSNSRAFAKSCFNNTHGGWIGKDRKDRKDLYQFHPLAEEFSRMLVKRVNRAWRTCGQNGGLMYLQSWPWDKANTVRDRQCVANGDFAAPLVFRGECGAVGGHLQCELRRIHEGLHLSPAAAERAFFPCLLRGTQPTLGLAVVGFFKYELALAVARRASFRHGKVGKGGFH